MSLCSLSSSTRLGTAANVEHISNALIPSLPSSEIYIKSALLLQTYPSNPKILLLGHPVPHPMQPPMQPQQKAKGNYQLQK